MTKNIKYFRKKPVNLKKITILLDNGYHKERLETELLKVYPKILTKIRIQITPKPGKKKEKKENKERSVERKEKKRKSIEKKGTKEDKQKQTEIKGFKPVHKRWVVERTNAWFEKCRILWKNCERTVESAKAKVQLCSIRLQLKNLCRE
jgi:hypothetical protein